MFVAFPFGKPVSTFPGNALLCGWNAQRFAMPRRAALAFLLLIAGGFAAPAVAEDWSICKDEKAAADTAIAACTRLIRAGQTKGNNLAITLYHRAISYRQKNDNENALSDYNESIRINPKYAKSFNNRGNVWKDKGDLDRAIADYNEAIRLDPKFALAYANRGDVWDDKGDSGRAIADLDQAIKFDPKYSRAYNVRGVVWKKKGDLD